MDIKELTDLFVTACGTNRCRYIPWWEYDPGDYNYKYNIFPDEEIKNIEEFVNINGNSIASKPMGNTGLKFFHAFVWLGFYNIVENFLDNKEPGIDVNITGSNENKITPLMLACSRGNLKMAGLLLKHGADISLIQMEGMYTIILYAHILKDWCLPMRDREKALARERKLHAFCQRALIKNI